MKKALSLILAVIMIISIVPLGTLAAGPVTPKYITDYKPGQTLAIKGTFGSFNENVYVFDFKNDTVMNINPVASNFKVYVYTDKSSLETDFKSNWASNYEKSYVDDPTIRNRTETWTKGTYYVTTFGPYSYDLTFTFTEQQPGKTFDDAVLFTVNFKSGSTATTNYSADGDGSASTIYKFVVKDKAYYNIKPASDSYNFYLANSKKETIYTFTSGYSSSSMGTDSILLSKGTYYFSPSRFKMGEKYSAVITCKDFLDIKTLKAEKATYSTTYGKAVTIKFKASPSKFDSSISLYFDGSKYVNATLNGKNSYKYTSYTLGTHTIKAVTSEGIKTSLTVNVAPTAPEMRNVKSEGTTNSTKITWNRTNSAANYYKLYQLSGKEYKLIYKGTATAYNVKKLSPGKTYTFKLVECYKNGKTILDSAGLVFKAITAPTDKPVITSIAQSGKTVYHPDDYVVKYDNVRKEWYTINRGNYSSATISVKVQKNKAFTDFYSPFYATGQSLSAANYKVTWTQKGKLTSATTATVKVQGVVINSKYNSVALGNTSSKTVKIKAVG